MTLEGIVATEFNADEGMKAAFAQSILDRSNGVFDDVIDIVAAGGRRRLDNAGVDVSYTGVARVDDVEDANSVAADVLSQATAALTTAVADGSFLATLQTKAAEESAEAAAAFSAVVVDVAATQTAIADAVLEVIVTTPGPTASPTPRPTVAPTASRGSDTVDAAYRLSGASAALLVLALAA